MRDHIRILGILNIVMGGVVALIGFVVFFIASSIAGYVASAVNMDAHDAAIASPIIAAVGLVVAAFFWVLSLPSIIGGWGLLNFRSWSWMLMVVISILHLFHVPLGTALGVYGIWVLFNDETRRLLGNRISEYHGQGVGPGAGSIPTYAPQHPPRPV